MLRVLKDNEIEIVLKFAKQLNIDLHEDPMEAELKSWNAPWREESLRHYLSLGWSIGAWSQQNGSGSELIGFSLAQPFVFFNGLTQTLWLESIISSDKAVEMELLEASYKWARDKHLQNLVLNPALTELSQASAYSFQTQHFPSVATAKIR